MKVALLLVLSLSLFVAVIAQQSNRTQQSQNQTQRQTKTQTQVKSQEQNKTQKQARTQGQIKTQGQAKTQGQTAGQGKATTQQKSAQGQNKSQDKQSSEKQNREQTEKDEYKIVKEGTGLEGIVDGKSTMQDVIDKFGKNYRWIVHKKYSYQMAYPNGLSFYICQSDKKKEVFDIEIKPPYKAKTSRGIVLGKSTVEDVQKTYGKSATDALEYNGVSFSYTSQKGKKVITMIDIFEKTGLRQCKVAK